MPFTENLSFVKLPILVSKQHIQGITMGKRDYRHRESKKPKKGSKKIENISFEPQVTVEIIKKGKKPESNE